MTAPPMPWLALEQRRQQHAVVREEPLRFGALCEKLEMISTVYRENERAGYELDSC